MNRDFYLGLAARGLRMPVGSHLVLHENSDADAIVLDGQRLGRVVEQTARRFKTPLAVGLMDLMLEKTVLMELLEVPTDDIPTYHFEGCPDDSTMERFAERLSRPLTPRLQAHVDAVRYIAENTDLVPVGMTIGPFSLMTKLVADPITPVFLAGSGLSAADDDEVKMIERCLDLALMMILRSVEAQLQAGAKLMFVAEPAANKVYISPKQLDAGSDIFDRYVMSYNKQVKALLDRYQAEMLFHCCGELTDQMVSKFTELDPAVLSLGSSRVLWEDARLVPKTTVLFGNLPTKRFFSDDQVTLPDVEKLTCELLARMSEVGHPFILASECDVLSVPGSEQTIMSKVDAFLNCTCP